MKIVNLIISVIEWWVLGIVSVEFEFGCMLVYNILGWILDFVKFVLGRIINVFRCNY